MATIVEYGYQIEYGSTGNAVTVRKNGATVQACATLKEARQWVYFASRDAWRDRPQRIGGEG